jgi:hypothetical protein
MRKGLQELLPKLYSWLLGDNTGATSMAGATTTSQGPNILCINNLYSNYFSGPHSISSVKNYIYRKSIEIAKTDELGNRLLILIQFDLRKWCNPRSIKGR